MKAPNHQKKKAKKKDKRADRGKGGEQGSTLSTDVQKDEVVIFYLVFSFADFISKVNDQQLQTSYIQSSVQQSGKVTLPVFTNNLQVDMYTNYVLVQQSKNYPKMQFDKYAKING